MNLTKVIEILKEPERLKTKLFYRLARYITNDKWFVKMRWNLYMDYPLKLDRPETFNEKLQWLKLYDRNPEYVKMVDKYEVKKYVADIIGEAHVIPTLAVYDKVEEVDFEKLPNQFVLKCTHDSGGVIICKDKMLLDRELVLARLSRVLKRNYYVFNREWPYKNVKHRIIAEQYMTDNGKDLQDYKIHCFNGEPKVILVCKDRFNDLGLSEDFYTIDWKHLEVRRPKHPNAKMQAPCPQELKEMLELSKMLSKGIPFVRTDFYVINHKVYFGELTFYPASGTVPFCPHDFDVLLGSWLILPEKSSQH